MKTRLLLGGLCAALIIAHLCHANVLWTEEDLPLAAARQMLFGKALYRDIWFDKPPLVPLFYLAFGVKTGAVLRIAGGLYVWACCAVAFLLGRALFPESVGLWAAGLLGFFLTFDTPSAVIPLAADLLSVLPHLSAIYLAAVKRPFWSGVCAGIAFLTNVKACLALVAAAFFVWPSILPLAAGFSIPCVICGAVLLSTGCWTGYLDQVWRWPFLYAGSSHVVHPFLNGVERTLNWLGFHAALVAGACLALRHKQVRRSVPVVLWIAVSFAGVMLGARFFPRYFFQILPAAVVLAAYGLATSSGWRRWGAVALLAIPLARFGPRYAILAFHRQPEWSDVAMDADSRAAAREIARAAPRGSTLYVWGYRPDLFVYTGMKAASRYLDSQAMTGVPADRHLTQSVPVSTLDTAEARRELARSQPDVIADGLSLYNPGLAMQRYDELKPWIGKYRPFARTRTFILYRRSVG